MSWLQRSLGTIRRGISRWTDWWFRLLLIAMLLVLLSRHVIVEVPAGVGLIVIVICVVLVYIRPPASGRSPVRVGAPVRGAWAALNSPGQAVPSHGTRVYGQAYAVDLYQLTPGTPRRLGWSLRGRPPEDSPCFGQPVLTVAPGRVVVASHSQRDHRSRSTWPLLVGMLTIEAFLRQLAGVGWILGNHVIVEHEDEQGPYFSVYAHLRRGSLRVRAGERVEAGQQLAQVGSTGNSSEPHLHIHLMDRPRPEQAAGIPWLFDWESEESPARDPRLPERPPRRTALAGMPTNGQVFHPL
ncbi:M23 family metallopeptidase [Actinomyces bowdenii]|uniref:M23 family metallopeptidase n=1 Tax=Actinomyces bowdenii TaxID=131109 RepID=A0A853EMJ3_9ACTO|nr:M23 family metallopeptidase [Actinomyces bowdenii]MBF0698212.1 M23 family metallopeptidase [Actinomyces bowdenii]NYS70384.1 M23 family metallopeptidase [Actinomyces bowdenii]